MGGASCSGCSSACDGGVGAGSEIPNIFSAGHSECTERDMQARNIWLCAAHRLQAVLSTADPALQAGRSRKLKIVG